MRSFLLLLAGAILIGLLSFVCFENKLKDITDDLITRTSKELDKNKIYGLDVSVVGSGFKTKLFTKISGTVLSKEEKQKALKVARGIYGVFGVVDDIQVEEPQIVSKKLVFEPVVEQKPKLKDISKKRAKVNDCQKRLNKLLSASKISFESAKSDIKTSSFPLLKKIADIIKECKDKDIKIVIEGHTDSSGDKNKNLLLSKDRALAVKEHLVNRYGLPEDIFKIVGYGSKKPIADNTTKEGRAKNRRIEFKIEGVSK